MKIPFQIRLSDKVTYNKGKWAEFTGMTILVSVCIALFLYWVWYDLRGITYFRLGESNPYIKWTEWLLIMGSIIYGANKIKNILFEIRRGVYDPPN